jgi:3-deoxy-D-manno-octulosonic-acid transferase
VTRVVYGAYTLGLALLLVAYAPIALARRFAYGTALNLRQRLGFYEAAPIARPSVWVHAVSVGETLAAVPIVQELRRLHPDLPVVLTTVTVTGARVATDRLRGLADHRYFPLDLPGPVRRAIAAIRPRCLVVLETELWPNLLRELGARGVPVMIANGRISDHSFRRYRRVRRLMASMLRSVTVFAMQSAEDARRVIALGAVPERVVVTGNVKNDAGPDDGSATMWRRLLGLESGDLVWIAGSTHRGEEQLVLEAHARALGVDPRLTLVLAPRHPERANEVARLIRDHGWPVARRSELPVRRLPRTVILIDTVGELAQIYHVADLVFVGGSLVPAGGHNVLEPASKHKPVLFGPHTSNFRESTQLLLDSGGGAVARDGEELACLVSQLAGDPALRAKMGAAGATAIANRQGAVGRTLDLIERFCLGGAR